VVSVLLSLLPESKQLEQLICSTDVQLTTNRSELIGTTASYLTDNMVEVSLVLKSEMIDALAMD
jgi:hypothetical protein